MLIGNVNHSYVNTAKLTEAKRLVEGMLGGDRRARNRLVEHLTTGDDSIFAVAALTNIQVINLYDEQAPERNWNKIATVRTVDDFETPRFYTFGDFQEMQGNSRKGKNGEPDNPGHVLPVVPEGTPYPRFSLVTDKLETEAGLLQKRGGIFSLSWERLVNDPDGIIAALPGLFTNAFLDSEDWVVWNAVLKTIRDFGSTVGLKAGQTVLEDAVPANSKLTRDALEVALKQLRTREYKGRPMELQQFKLIVPIGVAEDVRMLMSLWSPTGKRTDADGVEWNLNYPAPGWNPLSSISEIVESEYFTGTQWAIVATPPAGKRPGIELLKLRGHETPDIRLQGTQGFYPGGGSVGVFEGTFETDDVAMRGRLPIQGASWTPEYILYSDGSK